MGWPEFEPQVGSDLALFLRYDQLVHKDEQTSIGGHTPNTNRSLCMPALVPRLDGAHG